MGENKQIFDTEELQIIYVDTPHSNRWTTTSHPLSVDWTETLPLQRPKNEKGEKRVTLHWRNLTHTISTRGSRSTSIVITMFTVCSLDIM